MGRVSECSELISWGGEDRKSDGNAATQRLNGNSDGTRTQSMQEDANTASRANSLNSSADVARTQSMQEGTITASTHILNWEGTLSPAQQNASNKLVHAISSNEQLMIWAVCGAGKTEILFPGILHALQDGKRVCIATPRTDVVLELTPRFRSAFPQTKVLSLYGGSEDRGKISPLVLSTTHQLLRYYRAFDVVIVDEVDAFPYSVEPMLQYAVEQARKETSSMIYLTATPSRKLQKRYPSVVIPARFHRHPLPVPRFEWCGNWAKLLLKKGKLPRNVYEWVEKRIVARKQAFLFVPKISQIEVVVKLLRAIDLSVEGVHSEDPQRKEKVAAFRKGQVPVLVTTTILERGVTVPNIDVAVLGAEDDVFSESALVQIAGRVGRSPKYPSGDIVFFHYGKTEEMLCARQQIKNMNKVARKKGLIDDDRTK
ncbi:DEAD/DEAH box helicase [Bacillus sp. HMF5848]|nr:DEAD/DEAH box helicase [Bacillus sp. HMF5848]